MRSQCKRSANHARRHGAIRGVCYTTTMLHLYMRDHCAFSKKVIAYAQEAGITLTQNNIAEEENETFLMEHGGKHQTPYLVDDEKNHSLYGSDEIVAYLKDTYATH